MGNYEEEYRKYYSDTKAKLNIKSSKKQIEFKNEVMVNLDSDRDIYPKINNEYVEHNELSPIIRKSNYLLEGYEADGEYKPRGTYSGIDNYNNSKMAGYEAKSYYGYNGRNDFNGKVEEKPFLNQWGNRVIFKLVITVGLFISVIALKSMPYDEAKVVYTVCKEVVSKDFNYKEFVEDIKTININDEMDKLKVNFKIDEEDIQVEKITEEEKLNDVSTVQTEDTNDDRDETISAEINENTD